MATATDQPEEARTDAFVKHQQAKLAAQQDGTPVTPTDSTDGGTNDPVAQDTEPGTPAAPEGTEPPPVTGTGEPPPTEEPPAAPEGEKGEPAPQAEPTEPTEPPELSDEDLQHLWEAYSDRFLDTDVAKQRFQEHVRKETARQRLEFDREQAEQAQVDALIQRGQVAYGTLKSLLETAASELGKAQREEVFDPAVIGPQTLQAFDENLNIYGFAVLEESRDRHNRDLDAAIIDVLGGLPPLSAEQAEGLTTVVNNAARMYRDPNQSDKAFRYALKEMTSFVVERAREQAVAEERQRMLQRGAAAKKIADANAAKAAAAKLAAQRGTPPPETPASGPVQTASGEISQAFYEKRKKEGASGEELDRITTEMARQAALGRRF